MLTIYYIVAAIILLLLLPFASKKMAFHEQCHIMPNAYDPLATLHSGAKMMTHLLFAIILTLLIIECVNKPVDIADNQMYEFMYDSGRNNRRDIEPTFALIVQMAPQFAILLFIYALLSVGTHLYGILRNSPIIWLSMLIYIGHTFVLHDLVQIRAAVAAGVFLISIRYIQERNWILYYILITIAILFHNSALVFIPMYFLPHKRINRPFWAILIGVCTVMGLFGIQIGSLSRFIPIGIVEKYLEAYMGNRQFSASGIGPFRVFMCLILILMVVKAPILQKRYPYAMTCICLSIFSQICYLLFGDIPVLQGRLGELFGVADIFTMAMVPLLSKRYYYILFIIPVVYVVYMHQSAAFLLDV